MVTFAFQSLYLFADDHTLLKVIPLKEDRLRAAGELNSDLTTLFQFDKQWFIDFPPLKTKSSSFIKTGHH